jgi:hypothetical protein
MSLQISVSGFDEHTTFVLKQMPEMIRPGTSGQEIFAFGSPPASR